MTIEREIIMFRTKLYVENKYSIFFLLEIKVLLIN